jgi:two-component system, sensor histidine kinase FlrB
MLPISHPALMNSAMAVQRIDELVELRVLAQMHDSLVQEEQQLAAPESNNAASLAGAFAECIATSSRLELSYRELQREVHRLNGELATRNEELNSSLAQNVRMRLALQQIMNSMPCGVVVIERDGTITQMNPESARLLEIEKESIGEAPSFNVQRLASVCGVKFDHIFFNDSATEAEIEICTGERWLAVRTRRLFGTAEADQTILILRDITFHKRVEQEREATRKAKALAEVSTILAHEVRNPLGSLELFAELIQSDADGRANWISNLRAGIRTLSTTVNNVLTFHGSTSLKFRPLSLAPLMANAIQLMQPLARQAELSIDCQNYAGDLQVNANEGALQQVLLNVLSNAMRYTPAGGRIVVTLHTEDEQAVLQCSDSGCGIQADQIDRLFEPGFSGSGDTCGLGLAVCTRIMQQHEGRISVSNLSPSGASFRITLPALSVKAGRA